MNPSCSTLISSSKIEQFPRNFFPLRSNIFEFSKVVHYQRVLKVWLFCLEWIAPMFGCFERALIPLVAIALNVGRTVSIFHPPFQRRLIRKLVGARKLKVQKFQWPEYNVVERRMIVQGHFRMCCVFQGKLQN